MIHVNERCGHNLQGRRVLGLFKEGFTCIRAVINTLLQLTKEYVTTRQPLICFSLHLIF